MFWNKKTKEVPKVEEKPTQNEEIARLKARVTAIEANVLEILLVQQRINEKIMKRIRLKIQDTEEENKDEWAGIPVN